MKNKENTSCSFCGKPADQTALLVSGQEAQICDTCIVEASDIAEQQLGALPAGTKKEKKNLIFYW